MFNTVSNPIETTSRYDDAMFKVIEKDNAVHLSVKVVPGASSTRILGEWQGRLKVAIAAAPEKGKANKELIAFIAKRCGVKKGDVTVIHGATSPLKSIQIVGVTAEVVGSALAPA